MHSNVIKPANAIQTVYPRQNSALDISRTKISALALFRKTEYPGIAFNWKSATQNSLGIKKQKVPQLSFEKYNFLLYLRWLDWIFWGGYLPSLSINYVAMSKDMEEGFPELYYIKMKISYDLGFIAIGVAMAR